jgi:SAM-dependent methyltransferase
VTRRSAHHETPRARDGEQGAPRERTAEAVRAFWNGEAADLGGTPQVTIRDLNFRLHELHTLLALIPRAARLLDAGCGTGLGTLVLSRRAGHTVGIDASAAMLVWARRLQTDAGFRAEMSDAFSPLWDFPRVGAGKVEFVQGDILDLHLEGPPFDVITAQRLLINLLSASDQLSVLSFDTYMLLSKVVYPAACGEEKCRFLSPANAAAMEMACAFRTRGAVEVVGADAFFKMYVDRVGRYDESVARQIGAWIAQHGPKLPDGRDLGHQRLIVARAI